MHIPTIGDLRLKGELLECGCHKCGRHGYFDLATMPLPDELPVMFAAMRLRCTICGARNERERDYPLWARPDARQGSGPSGERAKPASVMIEGKGSVLTGHARPINQRQLPS